MKTGPGSESPRRRGVPFPGPTLPIDVIGRAPAELVVRKAGALRVSTRPFAARTARARPVAAPKRPRAQGRARPAACVPHSPARPAARAARRKNGIRRADLAGVAAAGEIRDRTGTAPFRPNRTACSSCMALPCGFRAARAGRDGRYWARTSDPQLVDTRQAFAPVRSRSVIPANRRFSRLEGSRPFGVSEH